jgi:AhpD family alkylhydroperoxidase
MTRVAPLREREAGLFGHLPYRLFRRHFGEVAEPLTVMAHHPKVLLDYGLLELAFERSNLINERLKNLAVLNAASMVDCEFCIGIGSALSRVGGVTEEQLRELPTFERSDAFSPLERLVLQYAVAMTRPPREVTDDLFGVLREHFSDGQLVELTAAIALENYRARFNQAFGMN